MAAEETKPKNIHTILNELQSLIIDVQEQYEVSSLVKEDKDKNEQFETSFFVKDKDKITISNAIHPLGPVNLTSVSTEFKKKIDLIKTIISKFRTSLIFEATQHNIDGLEPPIRQCIRQLKEESERLDPLTKLHGNIKICKELALDACQDMRAAFKFVIQETVNHAKKLGICVYNVYKVDDRNSTRSVSGEIFLLDIQFNESINQINKVTVANIHSKKKEEMEIEEIEEIEKINNLLTCQLNDYGKFKLFKRNLQILANLDHLSTNRVGTGFFLMRCITNDIKLIYEKEYSNTNGDISRILIEGHGIPLIHIDYIGPSIFYWIPKYKVIETDWNFAKDIIKRGENNEIFKSFYRMWITMEESRFDNKFLPTERKEYLVDETDGESDLMNNFDIVSDLKFSTLPNRLKFLKPKSELAIVARAKYVAWLEPPLFVADSVAGKVGELIGIINKDSFPIGVNSNFDNKDTQSFSLEELLIQDVVPSSVLFSLSKNPVINTRWEKGFDDSRSLQAYSLNSKTCRTSAKKISRVPFTNPIQIFGVLKLLRQQLVYNTLFQSCFNSLTYKPFLPKQNRIDVDVEGVSFRKLEIRFNVIDPPNKFSISFQPTNHKSLSIQITVLQDSQLSVTFQSTDESDDVSGGGGDDEAILDNKKLTKVLETCQDIPMLIEWVLNALDKNFGEHDNTVKMEIEE